MELTQQNLLRVGDIIGELERSLGSLKRQAAKAERYIAYRGEFPKISSSTTRPTSSSSPRLIHLERGEVERTASRPRPRRPTSPRARRISRPPVPRRRTRSRRSSRRTPPRSPPTTRSARRRRPSSANDRIEAPAAASRRPRVSCRRSPPQAGASPPSVTRGRGRHRDPEEGETGVAAAVAAEETKLTDLTTSSEDAGPRRPEARQSLSQAQQAIGSSAAAKPKA